MSKKAAKVENQIITDIAVWGDNAALPTPWVPFVEGMEIGGGWNGTTVTPPPPPPGPSPENEAISLATTLLLRSTSEAAVRDGTISDTEAVTLTPLFNQWASPVEYKVGDIVAFENVVYSVVQAHLSQPAWTPPTVPALFTPYRAPGSINPWVQPTGAQDAYNTGELVTHPNPSDGDNIWVYESVIDANTTEPGQNSDQFWTPISPA